MICAISFTSTCCSSTAHNNKATPPAVDSTARTDRLLAPQLSDELLDPKFQVAVSRQTAPENETEALGQLEVVRMRDSRGRDFNCYLPAAADGTAVGDRKEVRLPVQSWAPNGFTKWLDMNTTRSSGVTAIRGDCMEICFSNASQMKSTKSPHCYPI